MSRGEAVERGVLRVMDLEDAKQEPGNLQGATAALARTQQHEVAAGLAKADALLDQGTDSTAVEIRDVVKIEDDVDPALAYQRVDPGAQRVLAFIEDEAASQCQKRDVTNASFRDLQRRHGAPRL